MGILMRQAGNLELYGYWRSLRGQRSAPERRDVDPAAIRAILTDVFILEFDPAAGLPFRVAGSRTNALFGRELRGRAFLDLWRGEDRGEIRRVVQATLDEAQPMLVAGFARPTDHYG